MFIRYSVPYLAASLKIKSIIFSFLISMKSPLFGYYRISIHRKNLDLHWSSELNQKISLLLKNLAHHWRPQYIIKDHINII